MNPFILSPRDRLVHWKEFRKGLSAMPEEEQLVRTAEYWALAPLASFTHDTEHPESWPSPWEMISDGEWCRNSVAIGMEFTLRLSGWDPARLLLADLRDYDISDQYFVLIIDGRKVMNYTYAEVVDFPSTKHDVIGRWRFSGKFYVPVG
jgi:hypothetical protein